MGDQTEATNATPKKERVTPQALVEGANKILAPHGMNASLARQWGADKPYALTMTGPDLNLRTDGDLNHLGSWVSGFSDGLVIGRRLSQPKTPAPEPIPHPHAKPPKIDASKACPTCLSVTGCMCSVATPAESAVP